MTSKIVVNNIEADTGVSTVTFGSEISASKIVTSSGEFTVGTGASVYSPATNVLALGTNNAERVRINSTGNIGIGTDNPINLLHVYGQSRFEDYVRGNSNSGILYILDDVAISATKKLYFDTGSNTYIDEVSSDTLRFTTGGTERLRISNGVLLVGLTDSVGEGGTPADLNSTEVGRGYINLSRDDTAAADHILFGKNGSIAASVGTDTTNTLVFKTGTTERLRINSSGWVGIGTNAPLHTDSALDIEGSIPVLRISSTGNYGSITFADAGDDHSVGGIVYDHSVDALMLYGHNNTERLRILSGGGITFNGDTATANALDDYEEGTFSVGISQGVTSPGYTNSYGTYTKIGKCVYFTIRMQVSSGTNNSSQVKLSTLPFNADSTSGREGSGSFGYSGVNDSSFIPTLHIPTNGTEIFFYHPNGGTWNGNTGNGIVGKTLHMRGFYFVA